VTARLSGLLNRLSRRAGGIGSAVLLRRGYLLTRRIAGRLGLQIVVSSYDSPIPVLASIDPAYFARPDPMRGIDFDPVAQTDFLERELARFTREYAPPHDRDQAGPGRFFLRNGTYESVDAELLYAIVRRFEPRRIIELGSGFSTLIIREALARNGADPREVHTTYDPYPSDLLPAELAVRPDNAQTVAIDAFQELGENDVLFVDTSHTVKLAGDVNRIVLEILPTLQPGVIVHFHDIFLPYPYSRAHLDDAHFWTEQYLLQAFLSGNPDWEVLIGGYAVSRSDPKRLAAAVPSFADGVNPGAFWVRRRGAGPQASGGQGGA
jgi:predicted O-methyltransferase YrrM